VLDKSKDGIMAVKFTHKESLYTFVIINAYLPPDNSVWGRDATGFMSYVLSLVYLYYNCDALFVIGDVNSRLGKKSDYIEDIDNIPDRQILDETVNKHGDVFRDFLLESNMCVLNGRVTPQFNNFTSVSVKGSSVVDYIAVPHHTLNICKIFKVLLAHDAMEIAKVYHNKIPDHSILQLVFSPHCQFLEHQAQEDCTDNSHNSLPLLTGLQSNNHRYFKRHKINDIPNDFLGSEMARQAIFSCIERIEHARSVQNDIDEMYQQFCKVYYDEMDVWFTSRNINRGAKKRFRNSTKPFWSNELMNLWYKVVESENKYLASPQNSRLRQMYRTQYLNQQNLFDSCYSKAKRNFEREKRCNIERLNTENPREFWEAIKRLGPRKNSDIPMEVYDEHGNVKNDVNYVLNTWSKEYEILYQGYNVDEFNGAFYSFAMEEIERMESEEHNDMDMWYNKDIKEDEVKFVLKKARLKKAVGIDNIPYDVLKNSVSVTILKKLFSKLFLFHIVPTIWRKAIVKPIPKNSTIDPRLPLQYRGISLLSTVYKLYAGILNNRLVTYLEDNNIYAEEQNGFRQNRSCAEHVFTLTTILKNRQAKGESTYVAYLDAEKAFDRVDRNLLLYKLLSNGIFGHLYENIKNIYAQSTCSVKINELLTNWFQTRSGIKQGDTLSPTLFGIFINDIVKEVNDLNQGVNIGNRKISILLYADDIVLLSDTENGLQAMLNVVHNWGKKFMIKFNEKKSNIVHYRKPHVARTSKQFLLGDCVLSIVKQYKYLGIILNEFVDFNVTADTLSGAANRALGAIISKYKQINGLGYYTYTKLYNSGVCPILDYCSEIWGFKEFKQIEAIQHKAIRIFLGVHRYTPLPAVDGDMGWSACATRRKVAMFRFWNRLMDMEDDRLPKTVFNWDVNLTGIKSWSKDMESLFSKLDLSDKFLNRQLISINSVWALLHEHFCKNWKEKVNNMPKLRTYTKFKNVYEIEPYVLSFMSRQRRSYLAQLRTGILPLQLEVGRWTNKPVEERLCLICNNGYVEDEVHFLFCCNSYDCERQDFYNYMTNTTPNFIDMSSEQKLQLSMTKEHVQIFSKYLCNIYQMRQRKLFI